MDTPKKVAVFLLALLLPLSYASAGTVLLSSDNPADMALSTFLAENTGGKLVVSPWGVFNSTVVGEILSEKPGEVVIIGGPVAVPKAYSSALEGKGIHVVRFSGKDRFETADMVINWSLERGYKPKGDFYILDGWDEGLIAYTLNQSPHGLILIVNTMSHHDLVNAIHEKAGIGTKMMAAPTGYGRSVYVDPCIFPGGDLPCNCTPMRMDEMKTMAFAIDRLIALADHVGNESLRSELLLKAKTAKRLAPTDHKKAKELVMEGIAMAYSAIASKPGPAATSSKGTG